MNRLHVFTGILAAFAALLSTSACRRNAVQAYEIARFGESGYDVTLIGDLQAPTLPFVSNHVTFRAVNKDREPIVGDLYNGDWGDSGFRDRFPRETWFRPNVLIFVASFAENKRFRTRPNDEIDITNATSSRVRQVRVLCSDLLLLFDLDAGERISVPSTSSTYIAVTGAFASGAPISTASIVAEPSNGAARFGITIHDDRTTVAKLHSRQ